MKKCVSIQCKEMTKKLPIWQNHCQETTIEEAKQCQKVPVGQGAQRLDNRVVV